MTLPKFQEPDWSQLPKEAVAWAVDRSGMAYSYTEEPKALHLTWSISGIARPCGMFDLTGIDWRTTLRLRPTEEANPTLKGHEVAEAMKGIVKDLEDCAEAQRNYELEHLAEDFMKALLANPQSWESKFEDASSWAFKAAAAFIDEREKRRLP